MKYQIEMPEGWKPGECNTCPLFTNRKCGPSEECPLAKAVPKPKPKLVKVKSWAFQFIDKGGAKKWTTFPTKVGPFKHYPCTIHIKNYEPKLVRMEAWVYPNDIFTGPPYRYKGEKGTVPCHIVFDRKHLKGRGVNDRHKQMQRY